MKTTQEIYNVLKDITLTETEINQFIDDLTEEESKSVLRDVMKTYVHVSN